MSAPYFESLMVPTNEVASAAPLAAGGRAISREWLDVDVSLYLDRCQIDTPDRLIKETWKRVAERREHVGLVYDFGAGDGRFARYGSFGRYLGWEIDLSRCSISDAPANVEFVHRCAFVDDCVDADVCIGNPPFVRNQDLPAGWRTRVAERLEERSGVRLSGLANAWQYFFLLSILSSAERGLCALVIPYEWVSRPSSKALREFIIRQGWEVDVFRLGDTSFDSVLTTSSITIVDKAARTGRWRFFQEDAGGGFQALPNESVSPEGHLPYFRPATTALGPRAMRGLSPGSQRIFTLTESERARCGLVVGADVLACVTSLRPLSPDQRVLDEETFGSVLRDGGAKCWLVNTEKTPGRKLAAYLAEVTEAERSTATCVSRSTWWRFTMPPAPDLLVATSFKGLRPKMLTNEVGARAVGGVAGIHGLPAGDHLRFLAGMDGRSIADRIVSHANGLRKIEIHQLNGLIDEIFRACPR